MGSFCCWQRECTGRAHPTAFGGCSLPSLAAEVSEGRFSQHWGWLAARCGCCGAPRVSRARPGLGPEHPDRTALPLGSELSLTNNCIQNSLCRFHAPVPGSDSMQFLTIKK